MSRPRISIAGLLLLVLGVALGLAALREGSAVWAGGIFTVTVFSMVGAILGAGFGRGARRVFWTGFAAFGWTGLVLHFAPWFSEQLGTKTLAHPVAVLLYPNLHEHPLKPPSRPIELQKLDPAPGPDGRGAGRFQNSTDQGGRLIPVRFQVLLGPLPPARPSAEFKRICVCLEILLLAVLGGGLARYFASGRKGMLGGRAEAGS